MEILEIKKVPLNSTNKYNCYNCNYFTSRKSQYDRHLLTAKHKKNNEEINNEQKSSLLLCGICNKTFKTNSGRWKHEQKCKIINNKEDNQLLNKDALVDYIKESNEIKEILLKENEELKLQLKQQNKQISKLIPKVGSTTINNNKLSINVFLNEKCKDAISIDKFINNIEISLKNLLTTKTKGIGIGINEIISENINKLSVYERPIHCTDIKRETLYIKNDTWEKDVDKLNTINMLKALQSHQFKSMQKWLVQHPDYNKDEKLKHEYMILVNKCSSSFNEHEKKLFKNICETTYIKEKDLMKE